MVATSRQIIAARALLGWAPKDLAARLGVNSTSVTRLEQGVTKRLLARATEVFEAEGIIFLGPPRDDGEGVLKLAPKGSATTT